MFSSAARTSGPLRDQLRGQAHRQNARQLEAGELEALGQALARQMAGQHDQRVPLDRERLAKGGKVASVWATSASWAATSSRETWPCWYW